MTLRVDNTSQSSRFVNNLEYGICSIYSNLLSLDSQIKILFNDVNHDIIANQYSFCGIREHKKRHFFTIILYVNIVHSVFNKKLV